MMHPTNPPINCGGGKCMSTTIYFNLGKNVDYFIEKNTNISESSHHPPCSSLVQEVVTMIKFIGTKIT